jgi:hypothetical protein
VNCDRSDLVSVFVVVMVSPPSWSWLQQLLQPWLSLRPGDANRKEKRGVSLKFP